MRAGIGCGYDTIMKILSLQSTRIAIDGGEDDGLLVMADEVLVAVLVCLDRPIYGPEQGQWHLEAGFGPCAARPATFPRLEPALRWIAERVGADPHQASDCAGRHLQTASY